MSKAIIRLIDSWPSFREFAEDLRLRNPSHGRVMKVRGRIPRAYWHDLVRAAKRRGMIDVSLEYLEKIHRGVGERRS